MTKMMIKLVIFDLDGTLLNTLEDLATACNYALAQCGFPPHDTNAYKRFVGRGIMNLFRSSLPEETRNDHMAEQMKKHFVPYYNEHKCDLTRPYSGIPELLKKLVSRNIKIAIASNKYQEGTEQLVRKFFGEYPFVAVLGEREGKPIKPDAGIIHEAIQLAGNIAPEETIYCGDSDVDMLTGKNAGVKTVGVTWGFRDKEELASYSPWQIVDNSDGLFDIITADLK